MIKLKTLIISLFISSFGASTFANSNEIETTSDNNTVTLYFVRHGKTMLNTLDRVQGWADSPLTPAGREVAKFLGEGIKNIHFKAAYASDLGRARETAHIVLNTKGQGDLLLNEEPGLRETNFGSYEGDLNSRMWTDAAHYLHYKSQDELTKAMASKPELLKDAIASFKALETLGLGEDYDDVKARGQKAVYEIVKKEAINGGGNILIVSHGIAIGIILSDLDSSGKRPNANHMGNAAVSKVTYKDGKFTLEYFGDMSYVEKGKSILEK